MRIGLCRIDDSSNRRSWSGTSYSILKALQKHCDAEVVPLGPLPNMLVHPFRLIRRFSIALTGKEFNYKYVGPIIAEYSRQLRKLIKEQPMDLLFFPAGSHILSALELDVPSIYLSDATFRIMTNYYARYSNLWEFNRLSGELVEKKAIQRAQALIFASDWAAKSAIDHYGARSDKTHVLPFGANLEEIPSRESVLDGAEREFSPCRLLFVGAMWDRKGGQLAVDTAAELTRRGVKTELTVVGCLPPRKVHMESVNFIGFLDKNNAEEMVVLEGLYRNADFFILPTRSEAAGIVFCEACAHALPIISTRTGGVSTYVEHGETGYLLDPDDSAVQFAETIQAITSDPKEYMRLARNARDKYEQQLNWDVWGRRVSEIIREIV